MNGDIGGHIHMRRRAHRANSVHFAYPSSNRFIRRLDIFMYAVGIIGPIVSIPQLLEIYVKHNAEGVSVLTWGGYAVLSTIWLLYGLVHREKPLIMTHALWLMVNLLVAIGALIYR